MRQIGLVPLPEFSCFFCLTQIEVPLLPWKTWDAAACLPSVHLLTDPHMVQGQKQNYHCVFPGVSEERWLYLPPLLGALAGAQEAWVALGGAGQPWAWDAPEREEKRKGCRDAGLQHSPSSLLLLIFTCLALSCIYHGFC